MSETLQHDPRIKQQIKDLLYKSVYTPVMEKFSERLSEIITKNTTLILSGHRSFIYRKKFYTDTNEPKPLKLNRLSPALYPVMDDYLKDLNELNNVELPYVLGFINQVLNSSNNLYDYLRLLPESMHPPLKELIASCPCRGHDLPEEKVEEIIQKNKTSIELIKKRMLLNIIL